MRTQDNKAFKNQECNNNMIHFENLYKNSIIEINTESKEYVYLDMSGENINTK